MHVHANPPEEIVAFVEHFFTCPGVPKSTRRVAAAGIAGVLADYMERSAEDEQGELFERFDREIREEE